MATDSSTNKSRLEAFINYCVSKGWKLEAIQGAASNSFAESHAFLESGDQYAASKYFDFCAYGGSHPHAGHDWYSQGVSIGTGNGAVGFFQWLIANDTSQVPTWDSFFQDGNNTSHINAQLDWWFTRYGWSPGGDMSYTTTPGTNSSISFDEYKANTHNYSAEEMSNIWYVNFERGGSGQYQGHNWNGGIQAAIASWGIGWKATAGVGSTPPTTSKSPEKTTTSTNKAKIPCIEHENTNKPIVKEDGTKAQMNQGGGSPATASAGLFPNGDIPQIEAIKGQTVGWGGASGQCYGLAEWWVSTCGGNGQAMTSPAPGNPNLPNRPSGVASPGIPAATIPFDYPWGSGQFGPFTAYAGFPPGGVKTGDIVCMTNSYSWEFGHVLIAGRCTATSFEHYDQNWGTQVVTKPAFVYPQGVIDNTLNGFQYHITGVVRPKNVPR